MRIHNTLLQRVLALLKRLGGNHLAQLYRRLGCHLHVRGQPVQWNVEATECRATHDQIRNRADGDAHGSVERLVDEEGGTFAVVVGLAEATRAGGCGGGRSGKGAAMVRARPAFSLFFFCSQPSKRTSTGTSAIYFEEEETPTRFTGEPRYQHFQPRRHPLLSYFPSCTLHTSPSR